MGPKSNGAAAPGRSYRDAAEDKAQSSTPAVLLRSAAIAPEWLGDALAGMPCVACDAPEVEFMGVYVRPGEHRAFAYAACAACALNLPQVIAFVERRIAHGVALEACTTKGGAA